MSESYTPQEARNLTVPDTTPARKEEPHLTQYGGRQYNVDMLEAAAAQLPTTEFSLIDRDPLKDTLESKYWNTTDGQSIGPSDLLTAFDRNNRDWGEVRRAHPTWSVHVDKIMGVNYRIPALVYNGHLIDGIHRLTKALAENAQTLPVKVLTELPSEAEYIE